MDCYMPARLENKEDWSVSNIDEVWEFGGMEFWCSFDTSIISAFELEIWNEMR